MKLRFEDDDQQEVVPGDYFQAPSVGLWYLFEGFHEEDGKVYLEVRWERWDGELSEPHLVDPDKLGMVVED